MKVLFLDRDGVINKDYGYVHKWEDFEIYSDVIESLKYALKKNFKIIIVTNQSGIARGIFDEKQFHKLMHKLKEYFHNNSISLLDYYYCPHHPKGIMQKYKKNCMCRKPKPGMFLDAIQKHQISVKESIMIGDKLSDMEAAETAGIKKLFLINRQDVELNSQKYKQFYNLQECVKENI